MCPGPLSALVRKCTSSPLAITCLHGPSIHRILHGAPYAGDAITRRGVLCCEACCVVDIDLVRRYHFRLTCVADGNYPRVARREEPHVAHFGRDCGITRDESLKRCTYGGSGVATPLRGPMVHVERFKLFAPWAAARKHSLPGTGLVRVVADGENPRRREAAGGSTRPPETA
jgi:hypothetical protein